MVVRPLTQVVLSNRSEYFIYSRHRSDLIKMALKSYSLLKWHDEAKIYYYYYLFIIIIITSHIIYHTLKSICFPQMIGASHTSGIWSKWGHNPHTQVCTSFEPTTCRFATQCYNDWSIMTAPTFHNITNTTLIRHQSTCAVYCLYGSHWANGAQLNEWPRCRTKWPNRRQWRKLMLMETC